VVAGLSVARGSDISGAGRACGLVLAAGGCVVVLLAAVWAWLPGRGECGR